MGGIYFAEWRKDVKTSRRIAYAFRGEIQALQAIVTTRDYVGLIENTIKTMELSRQLQFVNIQVRREYFHVFKNNINNIGSLKNPLPELISRYYIQVSAIPEDLESYRDGTWKSANVGLLIDSAKELAKLIAETSSLGKEIVTEIGIHYP